MKMSKSIALKRKVKFDIFFLLNQLDYFTDEILLENSVIDDLNEVYDMTYSIKKFNELSHFEI